MSPTCLCGDVVGVGLSRTRPVVSVRQVRSGSKTEAETLKEAGGETGFVLQDGKTWRFSVIYGEGESSGCWLRWTVWTELKVPLKESKNSQFSRDKRPQGALR